MTKSSAFYYNMLYGGFIILASALLLYLRVEVDDFNSSCSNYCFPKVYECFNVLSILLIDSWKFWTFSFTSSNSCLIVCFLFWIIFWSSSAVAESGDFWCLMRSSFGSFLLLKGLLLSIAITYIRLDAIKDASDGSSRYCRPETFSVSGLLKLRPTV